MFREGRTKGIGIVMETEHEFASINAGGSSAAVASAGTVAAGTASGTAAGAAAGAPAKSAAGAPGAAARSAAGATARPAGAVVAPGAATGAFKPVAGSGDGSGNTAATKGQGREGTATRT